MIKYWMVMKNCMLIAGATSLVVAAVGGAAYATSASTTITAKKSPYLAGYADTAKSRGAKAYKYVTATFKVPRLDCSSPPAGSNDTYDVYFLAGFNPEDTGGRGVRVLPRQFRSRVLGDRQ